MDIISKYPEFIKPFKLFGSAHIITIIAMLSILIFLTYYSKKNRDFSIKYKKSLFYFLIIQEILYKLWAGFYQHSDLSIVFSVHLSSLSVILCIILLYKYSQKTFELMYFWAFVIIPQAVITPGISTYGFPHLRFFHILLVHLVMIFVIIFFISVENKKLTKSALIKGIVYTNIYAVFIFFINLYFDTNYMFINRKPHVSSFLDYFGPWPFYLIILEILLILLFTIAYALNFIQKKQN